MEWNEMGWDEMRGMATWRFSTHTIGPLGLSDGISESCFFLFFLLYSMACVYSIARRQREKTHRDIDRYRRTFDWGSCNVDPGPGIRSSEWNLILSHFAYLASPVMSFAELSGFALAIRPRRFCLKLRAGYH